MRGCALAALKVLTCTCLAAPAQESTFRSGLTLVSIDAEVTDGFRIIPDLHKEDFRVWDDDNPQTILYFSQGEEPLDVVLLFDVSGSMFPNLERIAKSAASALGELRSGDRVAVMAFAGKTQVLLPFTSDLTRVAHTLERDVSASEFEGSTRLIAAIDDAIKPFASERRQRRRRALLVFTDGHGLKSGSEGAVITSLWESDIVVTGVLIRDPFDEKVRKITRFVLPTVYILGQSMDRLAARTGGDMVKVEEDPEPVFRDLMRRLRSRYTFYYAMPEGRPGEVRGVRVELAEETHRQYPKGQVRARRGYRIPVN
jgi:VWFA-related protein